MKHIKALIITVCATCIILPAVAHAQTDTNTRPELKREMLRLDAPPTLPPTPTPFGGINSATLRVRATTSGDIASTTRAELQERLRIERAEIEAKKETLRERTEETRRMIEERKEEMRQAMEEKREEFKQRLDDRRQENIRRFANQMFDRFDAAIERLNTLADRIESRLDKLEDLGWDVTSYRALLEDARAKIELAVEANEAAGVSIEEVVISDDPKSSFEECRAFTKEVVAALKDAHQALVDVIAAIKAAPENADDDDDSTATTTSDTATTTTE